MRIRSLDPRLLLFFVVLVAGGCSCSTEGGPGPGDSGVFDGGDGGPRTDTGVNDVCGDSIRGITEACDDGNAISLDGCDSTCQTIEDGFRCPIVGAGCVAIVCGDKRVDAPETCDDGNAVALDGCSASCLLEAGWICPLVGAACSAAECGDGIVAGAEVCDDGDAQGGDGCSATCGLEPGFACTTPGQACVATVCGDGTRAGTEQCDDGNTEPFDGCDVQCRNEPSCAAGACTATCGDGVILPGTGESCDDGNTRSGDGCSSACAQEEGFECELTTPPAPTSLVIPVLYRDFIGYSDVLNDMTSSQTGHVDFNNPSDSNSAIAFGIVANTLGTATGDDGVARAVPVLSGSTASMFLQDTREAPPHSADSFSDWYVPRGRSGAGDLRYNRTLVRTLTLGLATSGPNAGRYVFDSAAGGSPGFFPLDYVGFVEAGSTPREVRDDPDGGDHNFSFTTEIHYWFQYNGTERLEFSGDDDLWVFVDGRLCLDVGGLHPAQTGIMNFGNINEEGNTTQRNVVSSCKTVLDARATAARAGDPTKPVYFEMVIFHAERHRGASNFKLTLENFVTQVSSCDYSCGDGIVTRFEVCDDGMNIGGYNGCMPGCTMLGPHCGDAVETSPPEECDNGVNSGGYGMCMPGCVLGGVCGDGIRQPPIEECDDGPSNGLPTSACDAQCILRIE